LALYHELAFISISGNSLRMDCTRWLRHKLFARAVCVWIHWSSMQITSFEYFKKMSIRLVSVMYDKSACKY